MQDPYAVGRTVARLRTQCGWSQEKLARELQLVGQNVSRDMIMNIERGRAGLTINLLAEIAKVMGIHEVTLEPAPTAGGRKSPSPHWMETRVTVVIHEERNRKSRASRRRPS